MHQCQDILREILNQPVITRSIPDIRNNRVSSFGEVSEKIEFCDVTPLMDTPLIPSEELN